MIKKIKNIILKTDRFLYKIFGSDKSTKVLENIKEAQILFSHINLSGENEQIRFVGGCVRKSICGELIDDIDLATSLEPHEIKLRLDKKNIKIIDTGISHGTVTVILNNKKFEITTSEKRYFYRWKARKCSIHFKLERRCFKKRFYNKCNICRYRRKNF